MLLQAMALGHWPIISQEKKQKMCPFFLSCPFPALLHTAARVIFLNGKSVLSGTTQNPSVAIFDRWYKSQ